jgi:hypothetical protein
MPGPIKLTTEELAATLRWMATLIDGDDSAGGSLQYEWSEQPGVYNVEGAIRYGNSMGQGSIRLFQHMDTGEM